MNKTIVTTLSVLISISAFAQLAQVKPAGGDIWGYINKKGETVIEPLYHQCGEFSEDGLAWVYNKKKKTHYFINQKGEQLATDRETFLLKSIFGFGVKGFEGGVALIEVKKKWGYMNAEGKTIIEPKYEKGNLFDGGFTTVRRGGVWLIVDETGHETSFALKEVEDAKGFSEGACRIKKGGLWGLADTQGQTMVEPQFKALGEVRDGLAFAKNDAGTVGFIDKTGAWKIEAKYAAAKDFSEGIARVKMNDSWLFVTTNGSEVKPGFGTTFGKISGGLAYAKDGDRVGFVDSSGKMVIKPEYDKVRDFSHGMAAARKGELWGFINDRGTWVVEPQYEAVKDYAGKP